MDINARRLQQIELKFARKALDEIDPTAAVVSIKASERRANLTGANAPPAHLVTVTHKQAIEHQETSTEHLQRVLFELPASDPKRRINGGPGFGDFRDDEDAEIALWRHQMNQR